MSVATEMEMGMEMEHEHEGELESHGEHELATELLEVREAAELEGFLPLLIGPVMAGLKALAPVAIKAAMPLLKQVGTKVLPKLAGSIFGGGARRRRPPRRELEAEHEAEMEGFLPLIGSVVSGLLGGEMEAETGEYEIARRYVRLSRLAGKRATRQIMAMMRRGQQPTTRLLRRIVGGAVRSAAETLFGGSSREAELASELLEVHEVHELEGFLADLIGPALSGLKKLAPVVVKAAVPMLKNVASQALPRLMGGASGDEAEGELEGFIGDVIGGLLGGEMELEAEAAHARASWLVRLAQAASRRAATAVRAHIARSGEPSWSAIRQIVANAILGAAGGPSAATPAPAALPASPTAPIASAPTHASGTWVRSGGNLVVYL